MSNPSKQTAQIIDQRACPGNYYFLRVHAPDIADSASPGHHIHVFDASVTLSVPIMRSQPRHGYIEILYQANEPHGNELSTKKAGETLSVSGPIGDFFSPQPQRLRPLLIGSDSGIASTIFMAYKIHRANTEYHPLALLGALTRFPFVASPSKIIVANMPDGTIASLPLTEDWGIATRLASQQGDPGCFDGSVVELAECWLTTLSPHQRCEVELFVSGPATTLDAAVQLAHTFNLPHQTIHT